VCTAVVLDMADVPLTGLRRIPMTTWLRLQRVIEGSDTACVLLAPVPVARSAAGVTITTGASGPPSRPSDRFGEVSPKLAGISERAEAEVPGAVRWAGAHDRSRRVAGLEIATRLSSPRRTMAGTVTLETTTHAHRQISKSLNHYISTSPNHQISKSPNLQISTSPHLQIQSS
jgi:hypothetical protein